MRTIKAPSLKGLDTIEKKNSLRWAKILHIFLPGGFHLFVCAQVKKSLAEIRSQEVEELTEQLWLGYKAGI